MPPRHALVAAAVLVAITACGSSSTVSHPSPTVSASAPASGSGSPTASPTSTAPCAAGVASGLPPLMAVLERKAAPGGHSLTPPFWSHDTLAIAGLNAVARAHATFQPRAFPYIGNAATLLSPREAYVLGGLVYYIDGLGTVWTLDPSGKQSAVAHFTIGLSQQEVSFAVSPDGCHLVATVLTIPPKGPANPFPSLNGTWKLDVMAADANGASRTIKSWTSTVYPGQSGGFQNVVLAGWDAQGPLVVVGSPLGTQNGDLVDNYEFFSGSVAHMGDDGTPGAAVPMPSGCTPLRMTPAGDITCAAPSANGATLAVVSSTGQVEVPAFTVAGYLDAAAGPGGAIAVTGQWRKGSTVGTLPANFQPQGWIGADTIFGRLATPGEPAGNAALAHLTGSGATIENLGFQGDYVGMLSA